MTEFRTPSEPGPQPDPMLQTGRRSSGWIWLFAIAMIAVISATLYGINNQEPQTAAKEPAGTEASATTGAAPQEQPAGEQNGQRAQKSEAPAQKDGGNGQAAPPNSPNNAAPQKDQSGQTNQKPQQ